MRKISDNVLTAYPFYRDGSTELRAELLEHALVFDRERLHGNHLYRVGDLCERICLVGGGSVRVYASGMSGRGVLLYRVRAGEICPLNARMVLAGTVALANAEPSADLSAIWLNRQTVRHLSARYDDFRHFVQQSVAARFEEIIIRISDITTRRVDHRLIDLLQAEFEKSDDPMPTVEMTHDDIALAVGAAREVVTRKLHEFERVGALRLGRGRISLQDGGALTALMKPKRHGL